MFIGYISGQWTQDEYQNLFDLVNLDLRVKAHQEYDAGNRKVCYLLLFDCSLVYSRPAVIFLQLFILYVSLHIWHCSLLFHPIIPCYEVIYLLFVTVKRQHCMGGY